MGGFECSTHHRPDGRRLDLIAATGHDRHAEADYRQLAAMGLLTVRDGVRWHLIEHQPGRYDWSSLDPMIEAARRSGTQVIWDLMHYGWPDNASPWNEDFADRFAAFAGAAARRIGPGGVYVPVNEISFLSWAGGDVGCMDPFGHGRGDALKQVLCRVAIGATAAVRHADPQATILCAEPLIRVHARDDTPAARAAAAALDAAQFEAVDALLGRREPQLGGSPSGIDVIGVNYYPHNQWWAGDPVVTVPPERQLPLEILLTEAWMRYRKPIVIAETGCEDQARGPWLRQVIEQVDRATARGVPVLGICLYPVLDHPGWADDRHCRNGLLCGFEPPPRPVFEPLAAVVREVGGHAR